MNIFAEVSYRFTSTDYLDDVSGLYAPDAFSPVDGNGNPSTWYLLQDRSYETTSTPIGVKGRQRGTSSQKDSYASFQVGISLTCNLIVALHISLFLRKYSLEFKS